MLHLLLAAAILPPASAAQVQSATKSQARVRDEAPAPTQTVEKRKSAPEASQDPTSPASRTQATPESPTDPQAAIVLAATRQMAGGDPAGAITAIEPALAAYEQRFGGERRQVVCDYSPRETVPAMARATAARRDAVALTPAWCDALFVKGFSLVDLHRFAEGQPFLERAVAMAPNHAHFINELGYVYQQQRDWQKSYDTYLRARDATAYSDPDRVATEKGRALRGMGYALIEQGKWPEAEALYNECLQLDPADAKAKNELQYIREQRARAPRV